MTLTFVDPNHAVYAEMQAALTPAFDVRTTGDAGGAPMPSRPAPASLLRAVAGAVRGTAIGSELYHRAKMRRVSTRIGDSPLAVMCGALSRQRPWVGDYENVNVLSFYDPAVLRAPSFSRFLRRHFEDSSCRGVRVWSEAARRSFASLFGSVGVLERMHVIRPTLGDLPRLPRRSAGATMRVLFVGRGFWVKGGAFFLRALRLVRGRGCDVVAEYVGDVPADVADDVTALGSALTITPPTLSRTALFERYARADVFVMLGMADSYGLAIVEAMAHALPVVACRLHSGVTELLELTGGGTLLTPPAQIFGEDGVHVCTARRLVEQVRASRHDAFVDDIAAALEQLVNAPAERATLGDRGRRAVETGPLSVSSHRDALAQFFSRLQMV